MSTESIAREHPFTSHALTVTIATAAFGAALFTRRTGNVWLGVGIASTLALGTAWLTHSVTWSTPRALARELGIGVVAGALMALATHALVPVALQLLPSAEREVSALYANLSHPPGPIAALPVLALAVVAEEVVWRGAAMELFRDRPSWQMVGGAAVLYALPQIASGSWLLVALALTCGIVWGTLRVWRDGLVAPMATHFVWNLVVFVFWPVA